VPRRKGHRHTPRERHVYKVLRRKGISKHRAWAMTMGMSPKTLHKRRFKTSSRQYSTTHRKAAAARRRKARSRRR